MEMYPKSVSKQCHQKILEQMNNSICQIKNKDDIGYFCYIKYNHNKIPVIIINNYIKIEEYLNKVNVILNDKEETLEIDDIIYRDKNKNLSIIKIKNKIKNINFIEIDDELYGKEPENYYCNESIYIIQNIKNSIYISYGIIIKINKNEIIYTGNIDQKYSFIFNLNNNKLIGIHKNKIKYYNEGINFKSIIKDIKNHLININEIHISIDIKKENINKEITFLNYTDNDIEKLNKENK